MILNVLLLPESDDGALQPALSGLLNPTGVDFQFVARQRPWVFVALAGRAVLESGVGAATDRPRAGEDRGDESD